MTYTTFNLGGPLPPSLSADGIQLKPKPRENYRMSFVCLPGLKEGNLVFQDGDRVTHPAFTEINSMWGGTAIGGGRFLVKEPRYANIPGVPESNGKPQKPQLKWYTAIVLWPVTSTGQVDADRLANGEFQVKLYGFTRAKVNNLSQLSRDYPLSQHDLAVSVVDEKHNMNFTPKKESLLKTLSEKKPELVAEIVKQAQFCMESLKGEFKDLEYDELVEMFSQSSSKTVGSPSTSQGSFSASFEADDLLDDLIK